MPLQSLFERSPVLPVDVTISLARYLHSIRATHKQALASERSENLQRAALLQIRVLQLVCKTLPSHPDYPLPENAHVVRELRAIAHAGFHDIDRIAAAIAPKTSNPTVLAEESPSESDNFKLVAASSLVVLFERIAAENTIRSISTVGILAGPVDIETEDGDNAPTFPLHISALIIPSQSSDSHWSTIRYEHDVDQLLSLKKLRPMGLIATVPTAEAPQLPNKEAKRTLATIQTRFEHGVVYLIAGTEIGKGATESHTGAIRLKPSSRKENGRAVYDDKSESVVTDDIEIRGDGHPAFKLYDLRPLAAARDEQKLSDERRNSRNSEDP